MNPPCDRIDIRGGRTRGVGKYLMRVASQNRINARHSRQRHGGIFHSGPVVCGVDPRMAQGDDDIRTCGLDLRYDALRGLDDVASGDRIGQLYLVPFGDLRRQEPDDADPQGMIVAILTADHAVKDNKGLRDLRLIAPIDIGADHWARCILQDLPQKGQPVVEFMITKIDGIVVQRSKGRNHWVWGFGRPGLRQCIGQRIALQEIAVVEKQCQGRLVGAQGGDLISQMNQPSDLFGAVGKVVIGQYLHMQIRRRQNAQCRLTGTAPVRCPHEPRPYHNTTIG